MPKPPPSTVPVTYTGGMDAVEVAFPSGDHRTVARGETVDVFPADAATLSREEWSGVGVGTAFDDPEVVVVPSSLEADPQ
jgi:hypothetical protein